MESKFSIRNRKEYKISEKVAMDQVLDLCEKFDVDVEAIQDKKQKKNFESMLNALLEYIRRGFLEFNDDGSITHHLQDAPEGNENPVINYKKLTGAQKLVMDGFEETDQWGKLYAVLGSASGFGENAIKKLSGIDLKVAEALTIFFL